MNNCKFIVPIVHRMRHDRLSVGDTIASSPVGSGVITALSDSGYPMVNHIAVSQLRRTDGVIWAPHGWSESADRTEPLPSDDVY